jgi:WD40 repeat protein
VIDVQSDTARSISLGVKWIHPLAFSHDGRTIAAGCESGRIYIVDLTSGEIAWTIRPSGNAVRGLAFSPDDRLLAVTLSDGHVTLIHLRSRQTLFRHELSPFVPGKTVFSPDGKELACAVSAENFVGRHGVIRIRLAP